MDEGERTIKIDEGGAGTRKGQGDEPADSGAGTRRMADAGGATKRALALPTAAGASYVLRGAAYDCVGTLSESSGEAQVFRVRRDGTDYALKIYYPGISIDREALRTVAGIDFDMVMRVYDFGTLYTDGAKRCYELMEYLPGGSLADIRADTDTDFFRRTALQAAAAIQCLHNYNIIHKDIKPANIFFRDEERTQAVLGDFGIASVLGDGERTLRTSQARTPLYAAPEMYSGVIDGYVEITPAADYYSLGMTLLVAWAGRIAPGMSERDILRRKAEGRLPGVDALPERVRTIIQGLTAARPEARWTYGEVEQWFTGGTPAVDVSAPFLNYGAFLFDPEKNLVAESVPELARLMSRDRRTGATYLYSGKITQWAEHGGNTKLAAALTDIVTNRYPADESAGVAAAIYTMDPEAPYTDIHGNEHRTLHEACAAVRDYAGEYAATLTNRNDSFWIYIETHGGHDTGRLRRYLDAAGTDSRRTAVLRAVYEADRDMPFVAGRPSSTVEELVRCFGEDGLSDDDWRSVTDGRLASWLAGHGESMKGETVRIMTEGASHTKALAYKALYNIDRGAAYDLRGADTPAKVGSLLSGELAAWQQHDDDTFAADMREYTDPDGRFMHYARLHGWDDYAAEARRCTDMDSAENRERLGAYDLRTAAYRLCRILGATPVYVLPSGDKLTDGTHIDNRCRSEIRGELRTGHFAQWLAVFYHEDPHTDFSEQYSYERALERWVCAIGDYDAQNTYYRRMTKAKEETARRYMELRDSRRRTARRVSAWRTAFYALCALWTALVVICGTGDTRTLLQHAALAVVLPVGGASALIAAARAYMRGCGALLCIVCGAAGLLSSLIPLYIVKYIGAHDPRLLTLAVVVLTAVYMALCHSTGQGKTAREEARAIDDVLQDDTRATLVEPLYYTFKTKARRFTGSAFGAIDDIEDRLRAAGGEAALHYALWCVMALALVAEMVLFSPRLLDVGVPHTGGDGATPAEVIDRIEQDVE